jgi:hypothetical protein
MTQIAVDVPAEQWPCVMADVASAVGRRAAAVHEDVYRVILREIPQLRDDQPLLALLASSVGSNVDTCLQIMEHRMDLTAVAAPAAAVEYARRLAQRGTPLTALLRAYRVGHARFSDWLLRELAQQVSEARMITAATLGLADHVRVLVLRAHRDDHAGRTWVTPDAEEQALASAARPRDNAAARTR